MVTHSTLLLPLRMTFFRTLNSPGIIDHGFNPKNETGLVVHLDPVLFDTMLDSASRHTAGEVGEIGDDLSFEIAPQLASKKGHNFPGAKAQCAMAQEFRIKFRKALSASKENIGREFALGGYPVV